MPDDPNKDPQGGSGGEGGQGDPKNPEDPKGDPKKPDDPATQFVTPTALQGVMDANKRQTQTELKKLADQNSALQTSIDALTKSIADKGGDGSGGDPKGGKKAPEDSEIVELRRSVAELKDKAKNADSRAETEKELRLDTDFKNTVTAALVAAGCEKPDEAYLVIKPRLQHELETGRVFATVKTEYGEEDLELKAYIERHFREEVLPHVFKGKMRTGAPAGGDEGGGGGYQFTREQALNAEDYAKDPEKYRKAIEQGRVKGILRPGAATPV